MKEYDIAVPIIKNPGWYDEHPIKHLIKEFYKDLETRPTVYQASKDLKEKGSDYRAFVEKNNIPFGELDISCFFDDLIKKYSRDESFSKDSQEDVYLVLSDVAYDWLKDQYPKRSNSFYEEKLSELKEKKPWNFLKSEESIEEDYKKRVFSTALADSFEEKNKRANNYAYYKFIT